MIIRRCAYLLVMATMSFASATLARSLEFESKPARTHLLELFTSEGCSSCPPAEAWLSKLKSDPRLWQDFVPLAFHVDYWDRLGWRDPYAAKSWTARQYEYSGHWRSSSVYTPGFVLDGREWHVSGVPSAGTETPGVLKVKMSDRDSVVATFQSAKGGAVSLELHVARLGFGLTTDVRAGENSGRKLQHDFVVLSLTSEKMIGGKAELRLPVVSQASAAASRQAVAVWITEAGQPEPIQAAGAWSDDHS